VWPAASRFASRRRWLVAGGCAAAFAAALAYTNAAYFQVCNPEDTVASTLADYRSTAGFEGMYEYEPPDSDRELIPMGLPAACLVTDPAVKLGQLDDDDNLVWNANQGSCRAVFAAADDPVSDPEHLRIQATAPQSGYLVLRLLSYPAWRVRVNGVVQNSDRRSDLYKREDGLIAVPLPQGPIDVAVDWTTTPDVTLGRWLSAICAVLLGIVFFFERQRSPRTRLS
jgi:hypothetical protein